MNFETILKRLNAIGGLQGAVTEEKKPDADKDGVPDWADKKPGADDTEDKKEKANEDIINVMRGLKAIQEAEDEHCSKCDCTPCECKDEKVDEALNTSKLADTMGVDAQRLRGAVARATAGKQTRSDIMLLSDTFVKLLNNPDDTAIQAVANLIKSGNSVSKPEKEMPDIVMKQEGNEFSGALKAAKDAGEEEFEVGGKKYKVNECGDDMGMPPMAAIATAPEESKDRYTLTITKADGSTLNATTDMPQDIANLIKLAGIPGTTSVSNAPAQPEADVEEAFGNTPAQTQEREPRSFGDTKNWGLPGTARADVRYTPPQQGDNPMKEEVGMFEEYKVFKESK
jgi:hypothetical protein